MSHVPFESPTIPLDDTSPSHLPEAASLSYGTSPLLPIDDPTTWPFLYSREATPLEKGALGAKLTSLQRAASKLRQTLVEAEQNDLIAATEDEVVCFTRHFLPAALPQQLDLALKAAERLLGVGEDSAAIAHMRLAEALLRLANGWGHAEIEAQTDGFMGLKQGQRASALFITTGVTRSQAYGDVAARDIILEG